MRSGKISESILKRSVLKEIKTKNNNVRSGAGLGCDAAVINCDGPAVTATTTVTLGEEFWGLIGINRVRNDIACMGGRMDSILVNITLPRDFDEQLLKRIMRQTEEICRQYDVQIAGGHTEIFEDVLRPVVSYTGIGTCRYESGRRAVCGQDIILTKWIGMEGAYLLFNYKKDELLARFPHQMLSFIENSPAWLSITEEAYLAKENGAGYVHNLSNGGIFNALWDLSVNADVGIKVDFKRIPVRQEIIEICEYYDINPYQLMSGGSLLITADRNINLAQILCDEGIPAVVIGETTKDHNKLLINEDEVRYLDTPGRDELWKIMDMCRERR